MMTLATLAGHHISRLNVATSRLCRRLRISPISLAPRQDRCVRRALRHSFGSES